MNRIITHISVITLFFLVLLIILPWQWGSFTDEQENIATAWLMTQNYQLYKDVFTHHAPLPYLFATIIIKMFGTSINIFRIIIVIGWSLVFGYLSGLKVTRLRYIFLLAILIGLAAPVYLFQMYLAETWGLMGLLITTGAVFKKQPTGVLAGSWIALWSLPSLLFPLIILIFWYLKEISKNKRWGFLLKFLAVQLLLPLLFLFSGTLRNLIFGVFTYNNQYYLPWRWHTQNVFIILYQGFIQTYLIPSLSFGYALKIFGLTLFHTITEISGQSLLPFLRVAWIDLVNSIQPIRLFLPIGVLFLLKGINRSKFLFIAGLLITLALRTDELFHLGPLVGLLSLMLIFLAHYRLIKLYLLIVCLVFLPLYNQYRLAHLPLVTLRLQEQALWLNNNLNQKDKILIIETSPYLYVLTGMYPAVKTHYLFPWILAVPEHQTQLKNTLINNPPKAVVVGGVLEPEFELVTSALMKSYANIGNGVFILKARTLPVP